MKNHNFMVLPLMMVVLLAFAAACDKEDKPDENNYGTFTDPRDGVSYNTVTIGDQEWMAENLRYLPEVVEPDSGSPTIPLYYVLAYEGNNLAEAKASDYFETYGALYNWEAARIACPPGWHLPTEAEWMKLAESVGGATIAGDQLKESGTDHWGYVTEDIKDEYGFTALPGGCCLANGLFDGLEDFGSWWTTNEVDTIQASYILITENGSGVYKGMSVKKHGFSVRCVKD